MLEKKTEIEHAFSMDDPGLDGRLDDSGEGTLERPPRRQQPMPPPRIDSYRFAAQRMGQHDGGPSRSGSNSEVYERLEEEEEEGGGGPGDAAIAAGAAGVGVGVSGSDDSDAFSSMDRRNGAAGGERLVKPSQIKSKKRQQGKQDVGIVYHYVDTS